MAYGAWAHSSARASSALAVLVGIELGIQLLIVSVIGLVTALYAARLIPETAPRRREGSGPAVSPSD